MAVGMDELVRRFRRHTLSEEQAQRVEAVRAAVLALAQVIDELCLDGREKALALTQLEYVSFEAIAAISREQRRDDHH